MEEAKATYCRLALCDAEFDVCLQLKGAARKSCAGFMHHWDKQACLVIAKLSMRAILCSFQNSCADSMSPMCMTLHASLNVEWACRDSFKRTWA